MIACMYQLNRVDLRELKVTDPYSIHRIVYDLFEDVRSDDQKAASNPSGILYADKGGDFQSRNILVLANRPPKEPDWGQLHAKPVANEFLQHPFYRFEVIINPTKKDSATKKRVPIKGRQAIGDWFREKAPKTWGFQVDRPSLQVEAIEVKQFQKTDKVHDQKTDVIYACATVKGFLEVLNREQFIQSFKQGIGRGRAFGCGLLQLQPVNLQGGVMPNE